MPIPVVCPSCQHSFAVPDRYAGKRGKCPECESVFRAPTGDEELTIVQASPPPAPPAAPLAEAPPVLVAPLAPSASAVEPSANLDFVFPESFAPRPHAAVSLAKPADTRQRAAHGERGETVPGKSSPKGLLIGTIAGGAVLVVAGLAAVIWIASNSFKPMPVASKGIKKGASGETSPKKKQSISPALAKRDAQAFERTGTAETADKSEHDLGQLPEFEKPAPVAPLPVPAPEPPLAPKAATLSVELIERLAEECQALAWKPTDQEQFTRFQELARLVTQAKASEGDETLPEETRQDLGAAAQGVLETLASTPWPEEPQLTEINKLSAAALKSDELGTFAYAVVIGGIPSVPDLEDRNLIIFELSGTKDTIAVPVKTQLEETRQGSRWLVLGQRNPGPQFEVVLRGEGSERKIRPALVEATRIVGEPKKE